VSQKNWAHILWPITFTNIGQYECHLIELFLQHFLIIYHKNYSHSRVPAATVAMATSALVQTNICAITVHRPIVHVPPSSICTRPHLIWFLPTSGHLIATT